MLSIALLQAVGMLWLKLDINSRKLEKDTKLIAVSGVTAPKLPLTAT